MLPLVEELALRLPLADLFPAFLDEPCGIFLDSGMCHDRLGRYSYIMAAPEAILTSKGDQFEIRQGPRRWSGTGDPFSVLRNQLCGPQLPRLPDLPPFQGGWAGYFGYELGRHLEVLPCTAVDDLGMPDMYVCRYDWVLAHDHLTGYTFLFADGGLERDEEQARQRLTWARAKIGLWSPRPHAVTERQGATTGAISSQPAHRIHDRNALAAGGAARPGLAIADPALPLWLHANFTRDQYLHALQRVKDYIKAGDIYQANLSQRFDAPLPCSPWALYTSLRQINPAPFAAYLDFGDIIVLSASPEQFLKLDEGRVETRPIKGTRPRGHTPELDAALKEELQQSEKDRAENLMIVDLLRNDLGRVCRIGSVAVPEIFALEEYPTVWHLVTAVVGELPAHFGAIDLLRACFPGGSITGAPKIRAMEIIDELEPTARGVYCGAIGYLGSNGTMNTSIVIRTMVVHDGHVYFQAGGGIVADSDPADEYQETLDKAKALIIALQQARQTARDT